MNVRPQNIHMGTVCAIVALVCGIALWRKLFPHTTQQENTAVKDQLVMEAKAELAAQQDGVLTSVMGDLYDKSFSEGVASVPPADADEQAKIDAAVAAKVAELQPVIDGLNAQVVQLQSDDAADKQAVIDAKAAGDAAVAALQAQFDSLKADKDIEDGVLANLNSSISTLQSALDSLHSLFPSA